MTDKLDWLTDPLRDFLAYLTVRTMQPQMERFTGRECPYDDLCDALGALAANGEVRVLGDQEDVYVFIGGQLIVHAARDWLEWAGGNWAAATSN